MPRVGLLGILISLGVAALCVPAAGQSSPRLWGTVETREGALHRGYLRWDGEAAAWDDLLRGSRPVPRDRLRIWQEATGRDTTPPIRVVEVMGYRISWNEEDPELAGPRGAAVRFAHLQEIRPGGAGEVLLTLRSGDTLTFRTRVAEPGFEGPAVVVEDPASGIVSLAWGEVGRVTLASAPAPERGPAERLHGTVEDRWGNRFTGYVAWGREGLLAGDTLQGETGPLAFRQVATLEREWDAAEVTLAGGGSSGVAPPGTRSPRSHGIRISDPGLGAVTVPWEDFRRLRVHPPGESGPAEPWVPARPLRGTVTTRSGETLEGDILWDADEGWSWETLDGSFRDVEMAVEFARIASIRRASSRSAEVTLRDGRSWELQDSNDVDDGNRGILVRLADEGAPTGEGGWVLLTWDEFLEVRFHHD